MTIGFNQADLYAMLWSDISQQIANLETRPLIAHYSSIETILSILKHRQIWFSHPLYMNDWEEMYGGLKLGLSAIENNLSFRDACGAQGFNVFRDELHRVTKHFSDEHEFDVYVACFSEHDPNNDDGLLSMWRGYGGKGQAGAIVFDTSVLNSIPGSPLRFAPVVYLSPAERIEWMRNKVKLITDYINSTNATHNNLITLAQEYFVRLKFFSLFTKHKGFDEEKEWRIVYFAEFDNAKAAMQYVDYDATPRGFVQRLKLPLKPIENVTDVNTTLEKLTRSIIIGPTMHAPMVKKAMQRHLASLDLPDFADKVSCSSTPYRTV